MIQGLSQDTTFQLRELAALSEANAGNITRRLHDLGNGLRTTQPIAREDMQQFVAAIQNDTLTLMNKLNGIQLELNS